ncbi:class I SAM-dependent methyltransferase [Methylobacterium sp. P31]
MDGQIHSMEGKLTELKGTAQNVDALRGTWALQSRSEWSARNSALSETLSQLINTNVLVQTGKAVDVGCSEGNLTDIYGSLTELYWEGIEPDLPAPSATAGNIVIRPGACDRLPYADNSIDCVTFANVFEHLKPSLRQKSINEIFRILVPGGSW